MKVHSGHLLFNKSVKYEDLAPLYSELLKKFLVESGQMPEEPEALNMYIKGNLIDLEKNRKPEGYNRQGKMRMIFPIKEDKSMEMYIYASLKVTDVNKVTESISAYLSHKGLKHDLEWDKMEILKMAKPQK